VVALAASAAAIVAQLFSQDDSWFDRLGVFDGTRHDLGNGLILHDVNLESVDVDFGTCGNDNASE
jgi:hypothetical protein